MNLRLKKRRWRYKPCGCEVDPEGVYDLCAMHYMIFREAWRTAL